MEVFSMGPGVDIKEALRAYLEAEGVVRGVILNGIGSVQDLDLAAPKSDAWPVVLDHTQVKGPGEVLHISGEILPGAEMPQALKAVYKEAGAHFIHIHLSVGLPKAEVRGGGLHGGKSFRSLTLFLDLERGGAEPL